MLIMGQLASLMQLAEWRQKSETEYLKMTITLVCNGQKGVAKRHDDIADDANGRRFFLFQLL